jgi:hypothetical protein
MIRIAALEGTDYAAWVDPETWDAWSLEKRTLFILWTHRKWERERADAGAAPTFEETMLTAVSSPRLKRLISQAWRRLPHRERAILQLMGLQFEETAVPTGAMGACETTSAPAWGLASRPSIQLDPDKFAGHGDEVVTYIIYHELAHAAYRTGDMVRVYREALGDEAGGDELTAAFETICDAMAFLWLNLTGNGRGSHNNASRAPVTTVTEQNKNRTMSDHDQGG